MSDRLACSPLCENDFHPLCAEDSGTCACACHTLAAAADTGPLGSMLLSLEPGEPVIRHGGDAR